ncbi:ArsR/SmtB family transcription factor [Nonomuraea rubra]|uniref:ArsR/SmtB family transcription factor n=1 Tax=Nonomuraea rubra TaxID=46180 RepID=UPI00160FB115|nr:metalloregulator ArsR/SmtB family transcription factor [Nonomuraea rubra]
MSVPLSQAQAELFRLLGHPVRIRVLELLQNGPRPVRDLLPALDVEPPGLSQHLAALRRSGLVTARREGATVVYALAGKKVTDLLRAARELLTETLSGQNELLSELLQARAQDDTP